MGDPTGPSEEKILWAPFGPTAKEAVARRHGARAAAEIEKLSSELIDEDEGFVQPERFALCALPDHDAGIPGLLNRWSDATLDAVLAVPDAEALLTLVGRRRAGLKHSSTPQARLLLRHVNEALLPRYRATELMPDLVADTTDRQSRAFLVALLARLGAHVPMLLAGTDRCIVWFPEGAFEWTPNPRPALLKRMVAAIASLQLVILPKSTTNSGFLEYTIVTADAAMLVHVEVRPDGLVRDLLPPACCEALMLFAAAVEDGDRAPELLGLVDAGAANAALREWTGVVQRLFALDAADYPEAGGGGGAAAVKPVAAAGPAPPAGPPRAGSLGTDAPEWLRAAAVVLQPDPSELVEAEKTIERLKSDLEASKRSCAVLREKSGCADVGPTGPTSQDGDVATDLRAVQRANVLHAFRRYMLSPIAPEGKLLPNGVVPWRFPLNVEDAEALAPYKTALDVLLDPSDVLSTVEAEVDEGPPNGTNNEKLAGELLDEVLMMNQPGSDDDIQFLMLVFGRIGALEPKLRDDPQGKMVTSPEFLNLFEGMERPWPELRDLILRLEDLYFDPDLYGANWKRGAGFPSVSASKAKTTWGGRIEKFQTKLTPEKKEDNISTVESRKKIVIKIVEQRKKNEEEKRARKEAEAERIKNKALYEAREREDRLLYEHMRWMWADPEKTMRRLELANYSGAAEGTGNGNLFGYAKGPQAAFRTFLDVMYKLDHYEQPIQVMKGEEDGKGNPIPNTKLTLKTEWVKANIDDLYKVRQTKPRTLYTEAETKAHREQIDGHARAMYDAYRNKEREPVSTPDTEDELQKRWKAYVDAHWHVSITNEQGVVVRPGWKHYRVKGGTDPTLVVGTKAWFVQRDMPWLVRVLYYRLNHLMTVRGFKTEVFDDMKTYEAWWIQGTEEGLVLSLYNKRVAPPKRTPNTAEQWNARGWRLLQTRCRLLAPSDFDASGALQLPARLATTTGLPKMRDSPEWTNADEQSRAGLLFGLLVHQSPDASANLLSAEQYNALNLQPVKEDWWPIEDGRPRWMVAHLETVTSAPAFFFDEFKAQTNVNANEFTIRTNAPPPPLPPPPPPPPPAGGAPQPPGRPPPLPKPGAAAKGGGGKAAADDKLEVVLPKDMNPEQLAVHKEKIRKRKEKQAALDEANKALDEAKRAAEEEANRSIAERDAKRGLSLKGRLTMSLRENTGAGLFELLLDAHVASIEATLAYAHEMADDMRRELLHLRPAPTHRRAAAGVAAATAPTGAGPADAAAAAVLALPTRRSWQRLGAPDEFVEVRNRFEEMVETEFKLEALRAVGPGATLFDAIAAQLEAARRAAGP